MGSSLRYATALAVLVSACAPPGVSAWLDQDGDGISEDRDCDDQDASAAPYREEVCDGVDNDCDGQTDEGVRMRIFFDQDGDGYGDSADSARSCEVWSGWSDQGGDCDDSSALTYPGAPEICDDRDNDCDGQPETQVCGFDGDYFVDDAYAALLGPMSGATTGFMVAAGELDGHPGLDLLVSAHMQAPAYSGGGYAFYAPFDGERSAWQAQVAFGGTDTDCYGAGRSMDLGDVDGDGLSDALFGTPYEGAGCPGGVAYLHLAPYEAQVPMDQAYASFHGGLSSGSYPDRAAHGSALGDVDGDGLEDVVVGSYGEDGGASDGGAVFVWHDPQPGEHSLGSADATHYGARSSGLVGYRVRAGADLNGDGIGDFYSGALFDSTGGSYAGAVHVVCGPSSGSQSMADADSTLVGENPGDYAGWGLGDGDVNGDGLTDLMVGAPYAFGGTGRAYVVFAPLPEVADLGTAQAQFIGQGSLFGYAVNGGDVDGDGFDEVGVGAINGGMGGCVYLMHGPISGGWDLAQDADVVFHGQDADGCLGSSLQLEDFDGDGGDDLVSGAQSAQNGWGAAYVWVGD